MFFRLFLKGYVCTNFEDGCDQATGHIPVYQSGSAELRCSQCQSTLQLSTKRKFNFLGSSIFVACLSLLGAIGWFVKPMIIPESIEGVSFAETVTRVEESMGIVEVEVLLKAPLSKKLVVDYNLLEGTAKAGADFNANGGQVTFLPGQTSSKISVAIVPDRSQLEINESFELVLSNIEGNPKHIVIIVEEGVNKDLLEKSDVIVADLSRLAADIANDYATIKMLEAYLKNSLDSDPRLTNRYEQAKVNILNARERYLLQFHDLSDLDPAVVKASIENRLAVIDRDGAKLQYKATVIMRGQLFEYFDTRIPVADTWIRELGDLVELPKENDRARNDI